MPNPLAPTPPVLVKLGSALVHAEEFLEQAGHPYDLEAFRRLLTDSDVQEWRAAMAERALLPAKRSGPV
jgi:hypothetical protein